MNMDTRFGVFVKTVDIMNEVNHNAKNATVFFILKSDVFWTAVDTYI